MRGSDIGLVVALSLAKSKSTVRFGLGNLSTKWSQGITRLLLLMPTYTYWTKCMWEGSKSKLKTSEAGFKLSSLDSEASNVTTAPYYKRSRWLNLYLLYCNNNNSNNMEVGLKSSAKKSHS